MFEKSSLRTRLSFYLAIKQLGGSTLTLRPDELHLSKGGESIEDTAKILSNFGNAFMLRTDKDIKLEEFKKYISIPIINGLSPSSHPTQILSDIFTVEEIKKKPISKLNITWIGDSNNVLNSLIAASIKFSFKLKIGCPKNYRPHQDITNYIKKNKNKIYIYSEPKKAVSGADVIFSDKVISMNDRVDINKKLSFFKQFKINLNSLIAASVKFSFKLKIGCPKNYRPHQDITNYIKKNKNKIYIYSEPKKAVSGADVIFSDKVISMNDRVDINKKLSFFKQFKINKKLMSFAKEDCIFLHCLPRGSEVDDEVFLSKQSKVWQQAANRVHVQKSILLYCFGKLR